jgi:hypothetical protein
VEGPAPAGPFELYTFEEASGASAAGPITFGGMSPAASFSTASPTAAPDRVRGGTNPFRDLS